MCVSRSRLHFSHFSLLHAAKPIALHMTFQTIFSSCFFLLLFFLLPSRLIPLNPRILFSNTKTNLSIVIYRIIWRAQSRSTNLKVAVSLRACELSSWRREKNPSFRSKHKRKRAVADRHQWRNLNNLACRYLHVREIHEIKTPLDSLQVHNYLSNFAAYSVICSTKLSKSASSRLVVQCVL